MKRRKTLLGKYLQIISNERIYTFFNKWREAIFQFRLKQKLTQNTDAKRSQDYNSRQIEIVLSEADEKVGKLSQEYEALSNEAEVLNIQMTKGAEILSKRKSKNSYSSLLCSSFLGWKSVIEKEKETLQQVFDSTKKYALSDFFIKMKNKYLAEQEIIRKRKGLDILFRIKNRILTRYCFHQWEEFVTMAIYGVSKNKVKDFNYSHSEILKYIDKSNQNIFKDSISLYSKRFKLLIFHSWKEVARKLRNLHLNSAETKRRINLSRMKCSFSFMRSQSNIQKFCSSVECKIKLNNQKLLLARSLKAIFENRKRNKALQNALKTISDRKMLDAKKYFINQLLVLKSQNNNNFEFCKKLSIELFESIGIKLDRKKLISALQRWRTN